MIVVHTAYNKDSIGTNHFDDEESAQLWMDQHPEYDHLMEEGDL